MDFCSLPAKIYARKLFLEFTRETSPIVKSQSIIEGENMEIKKDGVVSTLLAPIAIPKMFRAKQAFPREMIPPEKIPEVVESTPDWRRCPSRKTWNLTQKGRC